MTCSLDDSGAQRSSDVSVHFEVVGIIQLRQAMKDYHHEIKILLFFVFHEFLF